MGVVILSIVMVDCILTSRAAPKSMVSAIPGFEEL
jgi:hypothetical protein